MKQAHLNSNVKVNYFKNGKLNSAVLSLKGKSYTINNVKPARIAKGNLYLIPAMVDLKSYLGEPGNDLAESLDSICKTAELGGFERVLVHSNAERLIQNKEDVSFVTRKGKVALQPVGSALVDGEKEKMSNLFEMNKAGARVFAFPGIKSSSSSSIQITQQYINNFEGQLMVNAYDNGIKPNAIVAETPVTTALGFSGAPDMTEHIIVKRDIEIARYNCAPIHFSGISTLESVEEIAKAKKEGLRVTCDVSIFSLCYTDKDLEEYDSNLKIFPFLRTKTHQTALLKGLKNGVIDAIASYHQPQIVEDKNCEFDFAKYGAISLQTFMPLALKHVIPVIGWTRFIECSSTLPLKIAHEEHSGQFILIDTEAEWEFNKKSNASLSSNSNLFGAKLKGKVLAKI